MRRGVAAAGFALLLQGAMVFAAEDAGARLIDAVKRQDTAAVRTLLSSGVNANALEPDGTTALAWAAHRDDLQSAALLIRAGASPNAANFYGVTPLLLACTNRSSAMAEILLTAGANANAAASSGETPLMAAARTGDVRVVKQLVSHGANVNAGEHQRRQTALMWAASGDHPEIVRLLVEAGADVQAASTTGFTPLMFAARRGHLETVRVLVEAGADVNHRALDGSTALLVAAASVAASNVGYESVGRFLLDRGAQVTADGLPYTLLHAAVVTGKAELVKAALARGADANARAARAAEKDMVKVPKGATPFWLSARQLDTDLMRLLLAGGADPTLTPDDGTTALMSAAGVGQVEGPRARADFASPYRSRWDEARALDAIVFLLDLGADVNATNTSKSWSALHGAAHMGADRVVQLLVDRGAHLDAVDKNGQTPWSIASEGARDQLTRIPHLSTADLLHRLALGAAGSK